MPATFHSGKFAVFTINGTSLSTTGWTINNPTEKAVFKNSDTGSVPRQEGTFYGATVTLTYDYNFSSGGTPWGAPISVAPQSVITNVICYLNGTSGPNWNFTSLFVDGTPQSVQVDGKPAQSIACSLNGPYTPPGGTLIGTVGT